MYALTKWLNRVVKIFSLTAILFFSQQTIAQNITQLTLDSAYAYARANYPLLKQKDLINRSAFLTIDNIKTSFLPQVTLSGQATYQSEVTSIPISLPGFETPLLAKDQYKLLADINQLLYDGGLAKTQKEIQHINSLVEDQRTEVELYKLKDRINQLFLGTILLDQQITQTGLQRKDIELGLNKVKAQVANGTAFQSNKLVLDAEMLKNDQRLIELKANRKSLLDVMQLFIGKLLSPDILLIMPTVNEVAEADVQRPELQLYYYQDSLLSIQDKMISVKNRPKTSVFAQGGYGRPGLNVLQNAFNFYYIGGLKLSWSLGGLYTAKKERQINEISQQVVNVQKDVFLLNTSTQLVQQKNEMDKLKDLIAVDDKIIDVRQQVKTASNAQLENGVITANDYLREVNAEDQARLSLIAHQLQLLQAKINYLNILGKL